MKVFIVRTEIFFGTMWKNFVEDHDLIQLSGIIGITVSYVLVVIFNTVNGVGGTLQLFLM